MNTETQTEVNKTSKLKSGALAVAAVALASPAYALDVSGLKETVEGTTANTDTIGLAILAVVVGIAVIGWIRKVIR